MLLDVSFSLLAEGKLQMCAHTWRKATAFASFVSSLGSYTVAIIQLFFSPFVTPSLLVFWCFSPSIIHFLFFSPFHFRIARFLRPCCRCQSGQNIWKSPLFLFYISPSLDTYTTSVKRRKLNLLFYSPLLVTFKRFCPLAYRVRADKRWNHVFIGVSFNFLLRLSSRRHYSGNASFHSIAFRFFLHFDGELFRSK